MKVELLRLDGDVGGSTRLVVRILVFIVRDIAMRGLRYIIILSTTPLSLHQTRQLKFPFRLHLRCFPLHDRTNHPSNLQMSFFLWPCSRKGSRKDSEEQGGLVVCGGCEAGGLSWLRAVCELAARLQEARRVGQAKAQAKGKARQEKTRQENARRSNEEKNTYCFLELPDMLDNFFLKNSSVSFMSLSLKPAELSCLLLLLLSSWYFELKSPLPPRPPPLTFLVPAGPTIGQNGQNM